MSLFRRGPCSWQVYDEVVLTTDWEASGIMAVGMTFAAFTAEARRAAAAAPASGGTQRWEAVVSVTIVTTAVTAVQQQLQLQ